MHAYRESSGSVFLLCHRARSKGVIASSHRNQSHGFLRITYVSLHFTCASLQVPCMQIIPCRAPSAPKKTCLFWPDYVGKKICVKTSNLGFSFTTWNLLLHYIISQQEMALLKFTSPSLSSLTASKCMTRLSHWNNPVWARVSLAATGQENPACLGRSCPCAAWDSQHKPDDRTQGMPDRCRLSWSKYLTRLRLVNTVNLNLQA